MTVPALIRAELARLVATPLARLALVALMLVPLIYSGLYLWANRDPYAGLDRVPAALVVLDTGATESATTGTTRVNYGERVAQQVVNDGTFAWKRVSASAAAAGVASGTYDFSVTFPASFSTDLTSSDVSVAADGTAVSDPRVADIRLATNDTNSYLSTTIATQATATIRSSIAEQVGGAAAARFLLALSDVRGSLAAAAAGATHLVDGANSAQTESQRLADGTASVASGASQVAAGTQKLRATLAQLEPLAAQAGVPASQLAALAAQVDALNMGAQQVSAGAAQTQSGASSLASGLATLSSGASSLQSSLASGVAQIPNADTAQRARVADTIGAPVAVTTSAVAKASSYGAGLAPFFISLSAWIGIYALFLIVKPLSRRALTAVERPLRVTLAGWLTPGILGMLQMATVFLIITLALRLGVANPLGALGFMALISLTFAAIMLALNVWLGSVGQFLGLVLMVVQLVTAAGTFPWQTLPGPLAALHHVLPMSYAVDGLRQLMYGGSGTSLPQDAGVLILWLAVAFSAAALGAIRMTRARTLRDLRPSLIG